MPDNSASFAVQLPNAQPSLGSVLEHGIALNERRQERQDSLNEKQREFSQRNQLAQQEKDKSNRLFNLKQIQDATAQKQFDTPNQKINAAITGELKNIYDQAIQHVGESPEFVSQLIRDKIQNATQWHDMATADASRIEKQQSEFNRTLPNTDLNKVTGLVTKGFEDNYFNKDENGNFAGLKQPHLIRQDVNYFEPLNNGNILAAVTNDASPVYDFFKGIPKTAFENDNYVNKRGNVVATRVGGYGTPYSGQVTGDDNKPTVEPKYITAPAPIADQNGQPLRLASPELTTAMENNPKVKAGFNLLWEQEKAAKGLQNIDPHTDEILKEHFRYQLAEKQLPHEVKRVEIQKTPITRISVGTGTKDITFNDVAKQIDDVLPTQGVLPLTSLPSEAREFFSTSVNKGRSDISHLDPSTLGVVKANDGTYRVLNMDKTTGTEGDVVGVFSRKGTNLGTNAGQKLKQKILKESEAPQTKFSTEIENGIAAVMQSNKGVTREQVIEALKKAGKIK